VTDPDIHRAIDAVWRIESAQLIGALARMVRDVGLAEDLAQDALVAALERWPESGVPDNPGAWLMATAKHRAIDTLRRGKLHERKAQELGQELEARQESPEHDLHAAIDDDVGDDLLRLIFTACHPVLSTEARVALTLRLLGGLTTDEIARAFLVPEPTVAQRIVRAKRTLAEARVPFEVPRGAELAPRLASVLQVIYLIFNEGYSATAGDDWMRPQICEEALRLGRILAELAPREPEVHGLIALLEIQASRTRARLGPAVQPVCCSTRTVRIGINSSFVAASRRSNARRRWAGRMGRTPCRRPSPPAMRGRALRRKRIGCALWRYTMRSCSWRLHPLWSSVARSLSAWRSGLRRASRLWTP
jgi:RNA polymerase sigma factor (sigma-70 family)